MIDVSREFNGDCSKNVVRKSSDQIFLIRFEVFPEPDSENHLRYRGGIANCWIDAEDYITAERRAVKLILESGWILHQFEAWEIVDRETYARREPSSDDDVDFLQIYEQALIDGEVCVIHTYPIHVDADDN
ncbi:MAG: hypothetical protein ACKVT0_08575 [Planctomycetaceae bacterium]